ncbi:hypothetical protein LBMAG42_31920 [Deltaproteobacteria bacterium]|nr:hypothetical protein LBMAG42_31920 [Deltaproteobacteria bacterium]
MTLLLLLTACSDDRPPVSVDDPLSSSPVVDTGDADRDTGDSDTDSAPDTGEDTSSHLGLPCVPDETPCGEGAACCTKCCEADAVAVCTEVDEFGGCPLPDLGVDYDNMVSSIDVQDILFAEDDCAVVEGCVESAGMRRVLRFTTTTPNTGTADAFYGDVAHGDSGVYSECHEHTHFSEYAENLLESADGSLTIAGNKQAFCLMDNENWGSVGGARYTCDFQGISVGWADTYAASLDCQWVDITDVPAGDYTLRVTVNPEERMPERSYANNAVEVPVSIRDRASLPPVTDPCPGIAYGEYRDCGWDLSSSAACTPGSTIEVSCDTTCLGACVGDPVLRVCDGADNACLSYDALGANDRAECGSWCPAVTIPCPESGLVTALTAGWSTEDAGECTITVSEW